MRKLVQCRQAHPKGAQPFALASAKRRIGHLASRVWLGGQIRRESGAQEVVGKAGADEGARPDPTFEVALVQQLVIGREHRQPRNAQLDGQGAARGDALARPRTRPPRIALRTPS